MRANLVFVWLLFTHFKMYGSRQWTLDSEGEREGGMDLENDILNIIYYHVN